MSQTPNPLLQPSNQTPTPPHAVCILVPSRLRHIRVLHGRILTIASRNLHRVTRVQRALALSAMVVFVDLCAVLHLDAVIVDFVSAKGAVEAEAGLGLAFEVLRVVLLYITLVNHLG